MDLTNKNICMLYSVISSHGTNFVTWTRALSTQLAEKYNAQLYIVIPQQETKQWHIELEKTFDVRYSPCDKKRCVELLKNLFIEWKIDIAHTHHEAYDIPTAIAIKKSGRSIQSVWHLHDYMSLDKTGLNFKLIRKIGTHLRNVIHYGWYGRHAYYIGVGAEITNFITHYRYHIFTFPTQRTNKELSEITFERASVMLCPVNTNRLTPIPAFTDGIFTFFSFGGESYSKGFPCIFTAAKLLEEKGVKFRILITRGYTTNKLLENSFGKALPNWLNVVEETEDISSLFCQSQAYISASLKETFSIAIAEASIYGLPIIQSDIPGTWWNANSPSTFLFHVNNAEDLARQMERVIRADKTELAERCWQTSKINRERTSLETWVEELISIYKKI